jgi:hypothetical protein
MATRKTSSGPLLNARKASCPKKACEPYIKASERDISSQASDACLTTPCPLASGRTQEGVTSTANGSPAESRCMTRRPRRDFVNRANARQRRGDATRRPVDAATSRSLDPLSARRPVRKRYEVISYPKSSYIRRGNRYPDRTRFSGRHRRRRWPPSPDERPARSPTISRERRRD